MRLWWTAMAAKPAYATACPTVYQPPASKRSGRTSSMAAATSAHRGAAYALPGVRRAGSTVSTNESVSSPSARAARSVRFALRVSERRTRPAVV